MKETDGWVKIKKYTDDGRPVCGDCIVFNGEDVCQFEQYPYLGVRNEATPSQTCPIWYGESREHVAWCRYDIKHGKPTTIKLCDSDSAGAFKVYR